VLSPVLASLGGDASCIGDMNDWAVVSALHVPCTYGDPGQMAAKAVPTDTAEAGATPPLADNKAGAACVSDQDCPGGHCEPVPGATASSGGYCTRACNTPSDCGESGQCVALGRDTPKGCLGGCVEQSECRDGFLCTGGLQGTGIALSPSCQPKRAVDHLVDDSVGKACSQDLECAGGYCAKSSLLGTPYPGNYCTGRCYSDAECGESAVCLWPRISIDPGYCLRRCTTDQDCGREGYGCWTLGDGERVVHGCYPKRKALPDRTTGKACKTDADCGGAVGTCASAVPADPITNAVEAPGNYCTQPCALDAECGAGAQCIDYGTHGGICLASCSANAPCRSGYTCFAHLRDGDPEARVCLVQSSGAMDQDAGL
jgi:hypothetical protein